MPLERLSTAPSTTNQPPRTSSAARRGSRLLRPGAEHDERCREQPEHREREQPRALVAEADAEQPQGPDRAAERDRISFAAVGQKDRRRR